MRTIDDPRTTLMQSLLAGGGEGMPSPQDLLAQLSASDPTAAMLVQYLAQQRAAAPALDEPEDDPAELEAVETTARYVDEERNARVAALRALRRRVAPLYAELEDLRRRNEDLAAALGACARCWGDEAECPICEGLGRPGGAPPDPYLYARLIAPAARRLKHWDPADGRPTGAAPHTVQTASTR